MMEPSPPRFRPFQGHGWRLGGAHHVTDDDYVTQLRSFRRGQSTHELGAGSSSDLVVVDEDTQHEDDINTQDTLQLGGDEQEGGDEQAGGDEQGQSTEDALTKLKEREQRLFACRDVVASWRSKLDEKSHVQLINMLDDFLFDVTMLTSSGYMASERDITDREKHFARMKSEYQKATEPDQEAAEATGAEFDIDKWLEAESHISPQKRRRLKAKQQADIYDIGFDDLDSQL